MTSSSSQQWLSLVGVIWLQTTNGPNTDFPVYSSQLKHLLSISQVQLNNLAFASDAGKLFGWFSGVAAIYLPLWLVLLIGAALGFVGYGVQYLFLVNKITNLSYWQVFALTVMSGNGICWINTVCYLICIRNFRSNRGVAVGLSTSYVGLSAKLYTALADVFFHPLPDQKAQAYLLLNAVVPMLVTIVAAPLLRVVDNNSRSKRSQDNHSSQSSINGGFLAMFVITIATGVCAVVSSLGSGSNLLSREHLMSLSILLASPLLIPLAIELKEGLVKKWSKRETNKVHHLTVDEITSTVDQQQQRALEIEVIKEEEVEVGEGVNKDGKEEVGVISMLKKIDFWLYFFSYLFGATLGIVFLNNLGQIAESRGLSKTTALVSLSSSFGFFGRLLPSLVGYFFSKRGNIMSGAASIAALMAPMAAAFFLLLSPSNLCLYISTAVIGACTGAITSIAVSTTSELFGIKNFGVTHNVVVANIPIGSFLFGFLAALLYQGGDGRSRSCMGARCFYRTFIIWGCVCSFGTLLCTVLYVRTSRKFCSEVTDRVDDDPQKLSSRV